MLPQDGEYHIWLVQFVTDEAQDKWSNAASFLEQLPSLLSAVTPPMSSNDRAKSLRILNSFSASGPCWQETRVHGSYVSCDATIAMTLCSQFFPDEKFRVVCVDISQKTNVIILAA